MFSSSTLSKSIKSLFYDFELTFENFIGNFSVSLAFLATAIASFMCTLID